MEERIELRCVGGPLLGVLITGAMRLQVKRGPRLFEVDLESTLAQGAPVVFERVLLVDEEETEERADPVEQ